MTTREVDRWQGFILRADGQIDEVEPDGESGRWWNEPGLFDTLVLAGFPLHADPLGEARWDGILDVSVDRLDPREVTVYTTGPEPREHAMGPTAAELFLAWYRTALA
jgi:hypothetical protein